jgi:hypothetical protein
MTPQDTLIVSEIHAAYSQWGAKVRGLIKPDTLILSAQAFHELKLTPDYRLQFTPGKWNNCDLIVVPASTVRVQFALLNPPRMDVLTPDNMSGYMLEECYFVVIPR